MNIFKYQTGQPGPVVKEMEQQRDRYGDFSVIGDGGLKRVNLLAFTDFWKYRENVAGEQRRKYVPPYNPYEVAKSLGFYGAE